MPLVAATAGWQPENMDTSDVSLFSSIVGTMLSGGDLAALDVRLDGEPVRLPDGDPDAQAAHLLWVQLLARMQARPDAEYWREIVRDLLVHGHEHRAHIRTRLTGMLGRLGGLRYRPLDMWTHLNEVADDPHTVVSTNPPTYRSGFERFFDTGGRLTWAEPPYDVFDPAVGTQRLADMMRDKPALLVHQQQREPGHPAGTPVFGRHLSPGQYVYVTSNRPDEVFAITGGPKVAPKRSGEFTPASVPLLPTTHQLTETSTVHVVPVKTTVAEYYRHLWIHRLAPGSSGMNLLVLLDGHAAGLIGYSTDTMAHPYPTRDGTAQTKWADYLLLRYAFGAPHNELRLTRLMTMLALQRSTARRGISPRTSLYLAASRGLLTVETTRHPEAKGLRGLMQLAERADHPDGYRLLYTADWQDRPVTDVLRDFLAKERRWASTRQTSK